MAIRSRRLSRLRLSHLLTCGMAVVGLWGGSARAAVYYWDDNGATAGTTAAPNGTLGTSTFLSTSSAGTAATTVAAPTAADTVIFVAGATTASSDNAAVTSGGSAFAVGVNGTQSVAGLVFQSAGALTLGDSTTTINVGSAGLIFNRYLGGGGSGSTTGKVTINSNLVLTADQAWTAANIPDPGLVIAGNTTGTGNLTINENLNRALNVNGTLNMTGTLTLGGGSGNGSTVTLAGAIGGNVTNVTVATTLGTLQTSAGYVLGNAAGNTYTGTTSFTAGTLRLANTSGSATGAGNVTVSSANAVLGGNGRTTGLLTVTGGGQLSPSALTVSTAGVIAGVGKVGTLTLGSTGGLVLTQAALQMDLAATVGGSSDKIATGTLTLGSTLAVNLAATVTGNALDTTGPYTLIDANGAAALDLTGTTITTTFAGFGSSYTPVYSSNATGDLLVTFTAVPEPSTYAGVVALLALLAWRERRRPGGVFDRRAAR